MYIGIDYLVNAFLPLNWSLLADTIDGILDVVHEIFLSNFFSREMVSSDEFSAMGNFWRYPAGLYEVHTNWFGHYYYFKKKELLNN